MLSSRFLFDTDVLIDFLRLQADSVEFFDKLPDDLSVSAVTLAELYGGVREGDERGALDRFALTLHVVDVDPEIARRGGLFRRDYFKSHGVELNDAIIAATAESENRTLVTLNQKHFPMLNEVLVPYRKS